jgi:hypothetical protein
VDRSISLPSLMLAGCLLLTTSPCCSSALQAFDTEFTKVDQGVLFELILVSSIK